MKTLTGLLATLTFFALIPPEAQAQRRGGGSGTVNTPYGQFSMSDMASAGGNPMMAEQIREQKMAMLYQQQEMKLQQQYMQQVAKQQKARQDYLKAHPEVAKAEFDAQAKAQAAAREKAMARQKPKSVKPKSALAAPAKAATTKAAGALKSTREPATTDPATTTTTTAPE